MYVQHPYKFEGKYYAKIDGVFYEISKEVAMAMFADYRNEIYRSRKWAPDDRKEDLQMEELQEQFIIKSIYFEGMKQKEVAEILGVTKGALSQRLGTILRKMRTMYLEG